MSEHEHSADLDAAATLPKAGKAAGYPSPARAWWTVAVLTILYSLSLMDRQILALLVGDIRKALGISDFGVGLLQGLAFSLFYVTFGLGFGWAADRFPRRSIIAVGVILWSCAAAACGLARNFPQFLLARFGVGAGEGALNPAAYSLLSDTFPKHKQATAFSVFGAGSQIGSGLAFAVGGSVLALIPPSGWTAPLVGHFEPWRLVFLVTGLPGLLLVWLTFTVANPSRRGVIRESRTSFADALRFMKTRWRFYIGHFLAFGLLAASAYGYTSWTPTYVHRHFGLPMPQAAMLFAIQNLTAGLAGTLFAGAFVDRLFAKGRTDIHLLYFGGVAVVGTLAMWAAIASPSLFGCMAFLSVFNFLNSFGGVAAAALQITTPNNYRGQTSSLFLVVFNLIGIGVGPTLVGAFTTYLFRDDGMVGWAIALNCLVTAPLIVGAVLFAAKPMRLAVADADAWADR
jgi:MFS family permease